MNVLRGEFGSGKTPAIGLVLGAGGVVGQAYQAGVLSALQRETGWDPRQATIIVGTSAGSVTGAALRVGVPATDLAASLYGVPTSPRAIRRPLAFRPDVAAMTMLPRGRIDISERARGLDEHMGVRWPRGLRICAVRRSDGARVVFGRDGAPTARLAAAVLASCAIPGYFLPVDIGGTEYVDGGVHSATNADVLRSEGLDVVVVVSSMSAAHGSANGADGWLRRSVHRRMEREVARLQEAGVLVIRLEPGPKARHAMGLRAMAEDRSPQVIEVAYEETSELILATPALAALGDPPSAASAG